MNFSENGRTVSLGIIGLGGRGTGWLKSLLDMKDVRVAGVCDVYEDRVENARKLTEAAYGTSPAVAQCYHELLKNDDIEAFLVFTSWETHIHIAIDCLNAKRRVGLEVGGASSIEECWQLVYASERNGVPCMLLENCCYGHDELTVLNMVKMGLFGEVVHCAGGYQHDLRDEVGNGDTRRHYRQNSFMNRNGELYPTHELGPIAKVLNVNRGNRMISLSAMASKAAGLNAWYQVHRRGSGLENAVVTQGDIVTTMIKCAHGESIVLTHDCTLPRPYSRGGRVQGTKGIWMEDKHAYYLEEYMRDTEGNPTHAWTSFDEAYEKYAHPLWQGFVDSGKEGGHGGMDYLVMRAFIESVQQQTNPPIDVYDAAAWMAVTCLSEQSIAMGGLPVPVPDFTNGLWMCREDNAVGQYAL